MVGSLTEDQANLGSDPLESLGPAGIVKPTPRIEVQNLKS